MTNLSAQKYTTIVDLTLFQIERFYAKYLPLSKEMAKNLQSFGE